MTDHAGLIERLEKATGPDRELDREIALHFGWRDCGVGWRAPDMDNSDPPLINGPNFTSSLDAAIALVERVRPGCVWTIEADACWIRVMRGDDVLEYQGYFMGREGKATALAICLAILRSLNKDGTNNE